MRVEQGDRSVFHLTCWVALSVDVADLFELQSSLKGDRVIDATTQKNHILGFSETMRHRFRELIVLIHKCAELLRQSTQLISEAIELLFAAEAAP